MRCPPLEMFAWKRVVTDEFTYLDARDHEALLAPTMQQSVLLATAGCRCSPFLMDFPIARPKAEQC